MGRETLIRLTGLFVVGVLALGSTPSSPGGGTDAVPGLVAPASESAVRSPDLEQSGTPEIATEQVAARRRKTLKARKGRQRQVAPRASTRWARALPTTNLAAVNAAYNREYLPGMDLLTGFSGDESSCDAGAPTEASRQATQRALNFVRSLAGLAPVVFTATLNVRSQKTALMMSANRQLDHHPSSAWRCWSAGGAQNAAQSNLALAYPRITSAGVIAMYMRDAGAHNTAVGHRRWLLNPFAVAMGSGATSTAHAMTVVGPTDARRPSPAWVGWPTAGWFPSTMEPSGRWSISAGDRRVNLTRAKVSVWRNGTRIPVSQLRVQNGYAQPTLVWQLPDQAAAGQTYRVQVTGMVLGKRKLATTYDVRLFMPH